MTADQLHATLNLATLLAAIGVMTWASLWRYMR